MEDQELETSPVTGGEVVDSGAHESDAVFRIVFNDGGGLEQFVVDFVGDEW